jgi:hypothetical protein
VVTTRDVPKIATAYNDSAFYNTKVIASTDRFLKRIKIEVFAKGDEEKKLALAFCTSLPLHFPPSRGT